MWQYNICKYKLGAEISLYYKEYIYKYISVEIINVLASILTSEMMVKPIPFVTKPESTVSGSSAVITFPLEVKPQPPHPKIQKNPKNTITNTTTKLNPILPLSTLTILPIKVLNC